MKKSFQDMAARADAAYDRLVENLSTMGCINRDQAAKVANLYIKHKVVKLDYVNGVYNIGHGAFYDKASIQHVANK